MSEDVEYEFVKGQGWVPRLKSRFAPAPAPRTADQDFLDYARRYQTPRDERRYRDDLPTFEDFRRGVRIDRSLDRERYTLRYNLRLLYDQFIAAERSRRCEGCGREDSFTPDRYNDHAERCQACGWQRVNNNRPREPLRWASLDEL